MNCVRITWWTMDRITLKNDVYRRIMNRFDHNVPIQGAFC
jgi:hypothetical protein